MVLLYQLVVDTRLVVETLDIGLRGELYEIVIALHVLGQHDQVVGTLVLPALALMAAASRNIELTAHDRLQRGILLSHRIEELLHAEHVPVVGYRQGRLAVSHSSIDQVSYLGLTVKYRILGVYVQVGE